MMVAASALCTSCNEDFPPGDLTDAGQCVDCWDNYRGPYCSQDERTQIHRAATKKWRIENPEKVAEFRARAKDQIKLKAN